MNDPITLPDDLRVIDNRHLGHSRIIATHLLLGDEPALVDPGPASTIPNLEAGLTEHGLSMHDVQVLLLTHIHLDHAGATGPLVTRYPHLRVYVHRRGAPHLIAPQKLIDSASRLYGEALERLWGEIRPVPEDAITVLAGGEVLRIGNRSIRVYDAPGHAPHHVIYLDENTGAACVGDTAGVRIPECAVVQPATPPPDVDLESWQRTLDMLRDLRPSMLLLTHFGPSGDAEAHIEIFRANLLHWAEEVRQGLNGDSSDSEQIAHLKALAQNACSSLSPADREYYARASSVEASWHGLARYWRKRVQTENAR